MKQRILFIINPRSGTHSKQNLPALILQHLNLERFQPEFVFTEYAGHAIDLGRKGRAEGFPIIAVAGGDGTVNEVASTLLHSTTILAILPSGSGNGLARHLKIPLSTADGIKLINQQNAIRIDTFKAGQHVAIGTFGIGFDAHIAHLFSLSKKRGYWTYVKLVLREFSRYQPQKISLNVDGLKMEKDAFLLTFANSSQFGNNAIIAPAADIQDGILDIATVRAFPLVAAPGLIYRLTKNKLNASIYFSCIRGKSIEVINPGIMKAHVDGEPVEIQGDFRVEIDPLSLKIIVN